jgi:alpha-glucosidase
LYLPGDPATSGWTCFHTGKWYPAGATITGDAPLDRLPLFARANATLAATDSADGVRRTDEPTRVLLLFPATAPPRTSAWVEDDGVSVAGAKSVMRCTLEADERNVRVKVERHGSFRLPSDRVRVVLPAGENRALAIDAASLGVPVVRG